ncbi:LytTR family DNA-binding domain-containing protein [Gangjinia marincola]|uniref:LytTR family DNA-binding domain-containing protein n=1 Tax=Gangjinia marincola TaxID=578463 RepID=A0ABP3XU41_9FLAO
MNCIIIDDEPLAINIIKTYCEEIGGIRVLGTFTNALEAIKMLSTEEVDLIFIDIEMPQINGIDFIHSLNKIPLFIFTTAYSQYALEAFNLNAVDYLAKPIPFYRFVKAITRAKDLYSQKKRLSTPSLITTLGNISPVKEYIFVKSEYENLKINVSEIVYIQGLKDYLKIFIESSSKSILTLMSFNEMMNKLSEAHFARVHRSYIININQIDAIQRNRILIKNKRIPIGEFYRKEFLKKIDL